MKGGRTFVAIFYLFLLSFILFYFQFYQYYLMLKVIITWFLPGVFTEDLFQHGNEKSELNFK